MPTQHVQSESGELLQGVADAVLKARKVVVVTGAGISTNSGIPDFRSENGLYALIQAQFDAAARQQALARQPEPVTKSETDTETEEVEDGPPNKRRRISRHPTPEDNIDLPQTAEGDAQAAVTETEVRQEINVHTDTIYVHQKPPTPDNVDEEPQQDYCLPSNDPQEKPCFSTPRPKRGHLPVLQLATSPLSSPPPEDSIIPPSAFRSYTQRRLTDIPVPLSSSPLSSPPPVLFDPFEPSSPSDADSSRRSSTSPSEVDETLPSMNLFTSSQTSNSGRNSLPNMKGKDLFDASIWADPTRTSVFYTFATSLRQKIRTAEPTGSHKFISHLRDRGKLVRCYTQNIDQIEEKVGLSTSLKDGPGSRGRFSRRSTANGAQLGRMVEEVSSTSNDASAASTPLPEKSSQPDSQANAEANQESQTQAADGTSTPGTEGEVSSTDPAKSVPTQPKREPQRSGVECVFLHGSLEQLRCFLCGKVCSWDDDDRELETLSGQQPECPHCVGATVAREEKGKRALGVGKLRPDIVLYGEEHPNSHLISPIVTHDLALYPDMMLILGTSLRVHGLKVMVREFAKAVHSKGGKVVFVNFTKPSESSWGDIIDYWVQWDCDAWVTDLESRVPKLWQEPELPRPKKKRESNGALEDAEKREKRPPAANPVALRDTKVTGAYWTTKILQDLHNLTDTTPPAVPRRRASIATMASVAKSTTEAVAANPLQKVAKPKAKRPRKSAPGALEKAKRTPSTLNPNHGRSKKQASGEASQVIKPEQIDDTKTSISSILDSVKDNPRIRKRKKIDGEEVASPSVGRKRAGTTTAPARSNKADLKLAPMASPPMVGGGSMFGPPRILEPRSPPAGPPLTSLSPNLKLAGRHWRPFAMDDPLVKLLDGAPTWKPMPWHKGGGQMPMGTGRAEESSHAGAALVLAGLRTGSPVLNRAVGRGLEGELRSWGSNWDC